MDIRQDFPLRSRITIITGHYGSGKTELSINLAKYLNKSGKRVAIADLDVINPYFRSRESVGEFESSGITLIAPKGEWANADLPIVSGEIYKYISDPSYHLVIDIGGDKDGAVAAAQYAKELAAEKPDILFVVNISRPSVSQVGGIVETVYSVSEALRLQITGLVNNTNLGAETTLSEVQSGLMITREAASKLGLPFYFNCIARILQEEASIEAPDELWFPLERHLLLPWE